MEPSNPLPIHAEVIMAAMRSVPSALVPLLVVVLTLGFIEACSVALTPEGMRVRTVSEAERNQCELIEPLVVTRNDPMDFDAGARMRNALKDARNKVAALGGNGMRIISSETTGRREEVVLTIEALKCAK